MALGHGRAAHGDRPGNSKTTRTGKNSPALMRLNEYGSFRPVTGPPVTRYQITNVRLNV